MKRRIFLTAASTVGLVGAVSSATIVSSAYSSINTSVLLEEFNTVTRSVLDKFLDQAKLNYQSLGLDVDLAKHLTMPVQIINNTAQGADHSITYKNKGSEYISISVKQGVESISIAKTLA